MRKKMVGGNGLDGAEKVYAVGDGSGGGSGSRTGVSDGGEDSGEEMAEEGRLPARAEAEEKVAAPGEG